MAALQNLPEDVMIEILSWLPPESLLRFKSVCKSWYTLINHPKFVTKQLSNSLNHPNHVFLKGVMKNNGGKDENIFSLLNFPFSLDNLSDCVFNIDFPYVMYFDLCGHSHGLICLSNGEEVFLCNPATRELRKLPPSILHLTDPSDDLESATDAVGFGFDPKSKDFKVVRIVDYFQGLGYDFLPRRVEIYDLSKDRWREIENSLSSYILSSSFFEIYHQGTYYWWAEDEEGAEFILTFDMSEEVFGIISIPPEVSNEQLLDHRSFAVLNGSIVLFSYASARDEKTFHVWKMEKDDESSGGVSWSKLLTIGPVYGVKDPMLFVSFEELLMKTREEQLILYNIKTQHFKELPIKGNPGRFQSTLLNKTLVSVKGGGSNGF